MSNSRVVTLLAALVLLATVANAEADETALKAYSDNGTLVLKSDDGQFKWWFDNRVYLDSAAYLEGENDLSDGTILRRARMAVKTILWRDWYAEIDVDLAEESVEIKDVYLTYRSLLGGNAYLRVGNFRQPFGLEENFTSRYLMFLERSQGTDAFTVGRRIGVEGASWGEHWRLAASVFGADVEDYEKGDDETINFAARANYAPVLSGSTVLMLGLSGAYRNTDFDSQTVRFRTRPETNVADVRYIDTGNIAGVDKYYVAGGELIFRHGAFHLQSEYMSAFVSRLDDQDSLAFGGGYVYAGLFLTDDIHPYNSKTAELGRVIPKGEGGAWEVAARASYVDMQDKDVESGTSTAYTLGLNWYANPSVRVYMNYGYVSNDENATGKGGSMAPDDAFHYVQSRVLVVF